MRIDAGAFSLRSKLIALVTSVIALVGTLLIAFLLHEMDSQADLWMKRRASGMATMLAKAVAPSVEFQDADTAKELLASLSSAPGAVYAEARGPDGARLAAWNPERVPAELLAPAAEPVLLQRGGVQHVAVQVELRSGEHGALALGFSLEELGQAQRANLVFALLLALAVFALGSGAAFGLGTVLVRPLRRLAAVARQIAEGDLGAAERGLGGPAALRAIAEAPGTAHDEVQQLAGAFARMLVTVREVNSALRASAERLSASVGELMSSTGEQKQIVDQQAQALERTVSMAEEFKQASERAAAQADAALQVAARAFELGRSGEASLERTVAGLGEIRGRVEEIAGKIGELGHGTRRIAAIAQTVKDLADQSTVVALNAAIEAAHAGERGRAFAVVARELRKLADESGAGAKSVQAVLSEFTRAMLAAVSITEDGSHRIQDGLGEVSSSGQRLRELTGIVADNAGAMREIAKAVEGQNEAIAHLSDSARSLSTMMQDTVRRIELTNRTAAVVQEVSQVVSEVSRRYRD